MPRRRSPGLTDTEARLMAVLWRQGRATVADVRAALKGRQRVAYSTVQTILRILEGKGYVAHEKAGRAFIYRAIVDERQARQRALRHILSRLFENSPSLLVRNILEDERTGPGELERLKQIIRDA